MPTSFLFKNRLFIERDTKTKRIFSNLGLTFRNSKWSDYALYNTKIQFKLDFFKIITFIFGAFFSTLICLYMNKYYINYYSFNFVAFNLWFCADSFDYYLSFLIWLSILSFTNFINFIHYYLFFNDFIKNTSITTTSIKKKKKFEEREKLMPYYSLKYLTYNWLNSNEIFLKSDSILTLFETRVNIEWWNNTYPLIISTYKLVNLINKSSHLLNYKLVNFKEGIELKNLNIEKYKILLLLNDSTISISQISTLLWYFLNQSMKKSAIYDNNNNLSITFDNKNGRNLEHSSLESINYNQSIHLKTGVFYSTNLNGLNLLNYLTNFKELQFFTENVHSQFSIAKWNRWLYKYSILHRKILKNSHKLTIIKRLLNSGLYGSVNQNSNLWSIKKLNKFQTQNCNFSNQILNSFNYSKFPIKLSNHKIHINNSNNFFKKFHNLNNYESSFFFFL
jgi:hypothetical protein